MKKKRLKLGLGIAALFFGVVTLSSCTASFCTTKDQARMLFACDNGVTAYYTAEDKPEGALPYTNFGITDVYYTVSYDNSSTLASAIKSAADKNIPAPNAENKDKQLDFFALLDKNLLEDALACRTPEPGETGYQKIRNALHDYGYLKFYNEGSPDVYLWNNFHDLWSEAATATIADPSKGIDCVPSSDFKNFYISTLTSSINASRSCLTTVAGDYGTYGPYKESITMEVKDYGSSWSKGLFEGLLVWPIGAFIDVLTTGFGYQVPTTFEQSQIKTNGVPQLLAILVVTVVIRLIMALATYKQTMGNAKMTELQPEISKIQAKYPNANTNKYEKQRMAEEMQKLYKKNKINPFTTIIVLIIQFPVFICVWGALSGSAMLTNGEFCGLKLGESISSVLFDGSRWASAGAGAVTALFLFILMAIAQTVSMLLPQWMQKAKAKKVAKLGKNPAQKDQNNKMKWVTYIMLIMIIIMGFSLVSAMGVYWFVGALFSIAQTLITTKITEIKAKKAKGVK